MKKSFRITTAIFVTIIIFTFLCGCKKQSIQSENTAPVNEPKTEAKETEKANDREPMPVDEDKSAEDNTVEEQVKTEQTEKTVDGEPTPVTEDTSDENNTVEEEHLIKWEGKSEKTDSSMTVTLTVGNDLDSYSSYFNEDNSDNFDLCWEINAVPAPSVTLVFYPTQFQDTESTVEKLYNTLSKLPIPSTIDNYDYTNTPEVRNAVARFFQITVNDKTVNGNLVLSQDNGHVDFSFRFDEEFSVKAGDIINITVLSAKDEFKSDTTDM